MAQIEICSRKIGDKYPVFIIAEAADSHLGDIEIAKRMIQQAKFAGADCIKFQHHLPDEEMLPSVPISDNFDESLYDFLKKNALNLEQHKELKKYCLKIGIIYLCTPFSYKAAQELNSIGVDAFKIGSGEFSDLPSLKKIAELGKPMILSSGMATIDEIYDTYNVMKKTGVEFSFLNCVSEYPPLYEDINLNFLSYLRNEFSDIVVGHSDHTPDIYTSLAAVALGARIIEKHITIDKQRKGPDQSVSIDMIDLARLVDGIRKIEASMGSSKIIHDKEKQIREWAHRSVVAVKDIPKGVIIVENMLWTKRPGTGIPSKEMPLLIGKRTKCLIRSNTLLRREDVE